MELNRLTLSDRYAFDQALSQTPSIQYSPLSMLAFAPHFIWQTHFQYFWNTTKGWVIIFAEYADGIYMPLPPVRTEGASGTSASYSEILGTAFGFMDERNRGTAVSRIENIPEELKEPFEGAGCQLLPKDPDYLYRTEELIGLKGDRFKSQRAAYNQFTRSQTPIFQSYSLSDWNACMALFDRWASQKEQAVSIDQSEASWLPQAMLEDARCAHEEVLTHAQELGLMGRVVRVGEAVCGYTFGYARNSQVFCVLVEVADRTMPGLAQYLFREMCRECSNYECINTMDDSGLSSLARSKASYHPCRLVPNYIATMG